ncbi:methionyl-tRNA formyltransferase [Eikenella sp. S3360]|uniref:Methionyl-tRNA formyltransferase n=1 Tax=Eikenella glucosivorans TaxID=2766967 RepID=A0ABS0NAV6_9NEIS|nr:methionyl-tRNA formyltransferase [Eikenella glucosivorans]MBH5329410.1 methionyl-tRNA formyltransferase [Eikenella glucosivorans]
MIRKVIFAGTPDFAAAALRAIAQAGYDIPLVLTQPDRPKGRGMKLQASPVKTAALELGFQVAQPESLKNEASQEMLRSIEADIMVVAAYGLLLPQAVLDIPHHGCLNIHASLLPRWRGAAPIQRAIEAGDSETGICIMQMDAGLDTGAVISRHPCPILPADNAQTLHDKLADIGARAIVADLQHFSQRTAQPQPSHGITYARKLNKADAQIDWMQPAEAIERRIRAFNPVPGAWCSYHGKPMKIWSAQICEAGGEAGSVLQADKNGIQVACGSGSLLIQTLQPAGSARMEAAAFLAGHPIAAGSRFGAENA